MTLNSFGQKLNLPTLYKSNSRKGFIWRERDRKECLRGKQISVIWQKQPLFTCDARGLSALHVQSGDSSRRCLVLSLLAATSLTGIQAGLRGETASQIVAASLCLSLNPSSTFFFGGGGEKNNKYTLDIRDDTPSEILRLVPSGERGKLKNRQEVSRLVTIYLSGDAEKRVRHLLQPLTCTSREIRWRVGMFANVPSESNGGFVRCLFSWSRGCLRPPRLLTLCRGLYVREWCRHGNLATLQPFLLLQQLDGVSQVVWRPAEVLAWADGTPPPPTQGEMCHKNSH